MTERFSRCNMLIRLPVPCLSLANPFLAIWTRCPGCFYPEQFFAFFGQIRH